MLFSDLKHNPDATYSTLVHSFAFAKSHISKRLKTLGIEDISDFATRVGYLIVGTYGVAMVINLTGLYA